MLVPRVNSKLCAPRQVIQLGKAVTPFSRPIASSYPVGLRLACAASQRPPRSFSTTSTARLRDFFPAKETAYIRQTPPSWPHHEFTEQQMLAVVPGHREPKTVGDKIAWGLVRISRWFMDRASGLSAEQKTDKKNPTTATVAAKPLTEAQWLTRYIFLEV